MISRKTISFMAGIVMSLGISPIVFCDEGVNEIVDNSDSIVIEEVGDWIVDEYVDDFGDGIGVKYMKSIAEGTFSNTATDGSELSIITFFDPESEEFSFRLLEYNKSKATYYDNDLLRILFKFDDEIEEHYLQGTSPNGDLCLSYSKELNKAQEVSDAFSADPETASSKMSLDTLLTILDIISSPEHSGYYRLYENLLAGNDARCVIYIDSSKYSFTISADGFSNALDVIYTEKYNEADQLLSKKEYDQAIEAFENLNGYSDTEERILEAKYKKAEALLDNGEFEEAKKLFSSIEMYSNSAEMVAECEEKIKEQQYDDAIEYLEKGEYDDAIKAFTELNKYKDSVEKIKEAKYQKAKDKMDIKEYAEAKKLFEALGDYLDSSDKVTECESFITEAKNEEKYNKAEQAFKSKDYDKAISIFSELGEYKNSKDRIQECLDKKYKNAVETFNQGKYEEAHDLFISLGDYLDAESKAEECLVKPYEDKYLLATKMLESGKYKKAREIFASLQGYKDSAGKVNECSYEEAKKLFKDKKYKEAKDLYYELGDFKDSKDGYVESCYQEALQSIRKCTSEDEEKAYKLLSSLGSYRKAKKYLSQFVKLPIEEIDQDGNVFCTYSYDIFGNCIVEDYSNSKRSIYNYKYDDSGRLLLEDHVNLHMKSHSISKYEYNDNGEQIGFVSHTRGSDKKYHFSLEYEYDAVGNIVKKNTYSEENGLLSVEEYEYDNNNKVIKYSYSLAYGENKSQLKLGWIDEYTYDSEGSLIEHSYEHKTRDERYKCVVHYGYWFVQEKDTHKEVDNSKNTQQSLDNIDYADSGIIQQVQVALNENGYDCGAPDGDKGPKTTSVIQQYQKDNGLDVTGEIDKALLSSLGLIK